jgi:hypothetical protein
MGVKAERWSVVARGTSQMHTFQKLLNIMLKRFAAEFNHRKLAKPTAPRRRYIDDAPSIVPDFL